MSNKVELVKKPQNFVHASQCKEKLSKSKSCQKCLAEDARQKKTFKNHRAIFHHYVICHSGIDFDVEPRLDQCIEELAAECKEFQEKNTH